MPVGLSHPVRNARIHIQRPSLAPVLLSDHRRARRRLSHRGYTQRVGHLQRRWRRAPVVLHHRFSIPQPRRRITGPHGQLSRVSQSVRPTSRLMFCPEGFSRFHIQRRRIYQPTLAPRRLCFDHAVVTTHAQQSTPIHRC